MELCSKSSAYQIQNILSEGENSIVCEAYRKDLNYPVAQKILLKIFKNNSSIYPLELESLFKVKSSYCASVLHFEQIENKPAFILEWVSGLNIFQLLRQTPPLNSLETAYICWSVQQGLLDLRKYNLCHGDLSWSNILIDLKGRIRLIDFGKGNYMGKNTFSTPCFTAPEVLRGEPPSFYSDLFSLGVLETFLNQHPNSSRQKPAAAIKGHPLLDPNPQRREIKEFIRHPPAQLSLAQKINFIFKSKKNQPSIKSTFNSRNAVTQPSAKKMHIKRHHIRKTLKRSAALLFSWVFLSFFTSYLIGSGFKHPAKGSLSIRSRQWLKIHLNHQTEFTPFHSGALSPGAYIVKWQSYNQKGAFTVHIKENSHLLLTDKDFINKKLNKNLLQLSSHFR